MHEIDNIKDLFERYRQGQCTAEERVRLHAWLSQYAYEEGGGLAELKIQYEGRLSAKNRRRNRYVVSYAASIAAAALVALWLFDGGTTVKAPQPEAVSTLVDDVAPGGNRATLTLSDGQEILLDELQSGIVVGNQKIFYQGGDEALLRLADTEAAPLVLSTPRGGTYHIVLSDGTAVWLNAASSITYPARFSEDARVVEIRGEAYLAVSKDNARPFKVITRDQEIEVLGTEFNVSAYDDEQVTRTTLVEGSVRLTGPFLSEHIALSPGEQSLLTASTIRKKQVNIAPHVAWKDGNFHFDDTPFVEMMQQMAKWYDIDVIYQSQIPNERFNGTLSRKVTLKTVLELLSISEIKFHIHGNQLVIE